MSHADRDHAGGLSEVLNRFDVGCLWMNRPWLYAEEIIDKFHGNYTVQGLRNAIRDEYPILVELEQLATQRGIEIREVFAGGQIGSFRVLAPLRSTYLNLIPEFDRTPDSKSAVGRGFMDLIREAAREVQSWFETWNDEKLSNNPPKTSASNESSVVQFGNIDEYRVLLTADAGPNALSEAADVAEHLGILAHPNFFQIPHHGSRRNLTPTVLNRWLGPVVPEGSSQTGVAFCSVGTNKPEYPRRRVRNAILRRGYGVFSSRVGWINQRNGFSPRPGMVDLISEPFEAHYEE